MSSERSPKVATCTFLVLGSAANLVAVAFLRHYWLKERRLRRRAQAAALEPGVQSMLLGVALGDALGAGLEFQDAGWIRENVDFSSFVNKRGPYFSMDPNSSRNFFSGMYTDNTEMTLGLMRALIFEGTALSSERMLNWLRNEHQRSKRNFLSTWLWGVVGVGRNASYPNTATPTRVLPFALVADDKSRAQLCMASANATHPHSESRAANLLIAEAGRYLCCGSADLSCTDLSLGVLASAIAEMEIRCQVSDSHKPFFNAQTLEHLRALDALPDYHDFGPKLQEAPLELLCGPQPIGWASAMRGHLVRGLDASPMHILGLVLYLVKWHRGPFDLLQHAIWVGGDVDTISSLALGLVGLCGGLELGCEGGLPLWMVDDLENFEGLLATAVEFDTWVERHEQGYILASRSADELAASELQKQNGQSKSPKVAAACDATTEPVNEVHGGWPQSSSASTQAVAEWGSCK